MTRAMIKHGLIKMQLLCDSIFAALSKFSVPKRLTRVVAWRWMWPGGGKRKRAVFVKVLCPRNPRCNSDRASRNQSTDAQKNCQNSAACVLKSSALSSSLFPAFLSFSSSRSLCRSFVSFVFLLGTSFINSTSLLCSACLFILFFLLGHCQYFSLVLYSEVFL